MKVIEDAQAFKSHISNIQSQAYYKEPLAFGICRIDEGQLNPQKVLQATFAQVNYKENNGSAAVLMEALHANDITIDTTQSEAVASLTYEALEHAMASFAPFIEDAYGDAHKNIQAVASIYEIANDTGLRPDEFKVVFLFEDEAPKSAEAVYLKLYLLSLGKCPIRSLNLNGAFGLLENVAWSGNTPIELDWLRENEIELKMRNDYPVIDFVDKFPRFLQHIIPASNTRILDSAKVRFGAQLHAGTTVMPGASYINFNAGTTGVSMVEGRISSSAIVGDGSDVGGGASILGVLSGTDGNPISVGKNCLLGANSVCGIPLGDGCIIDAGVAVLEGTKFHVDAIQLEKINQANEGSNLSGEVFKGKELAGLNGLHFRQNATTGIMQVFRSVREIKLNDQLH